MAESVTIARPYAQAVYRLAREAKTQDLWLERLKRLSVIVQDPEMAGVIGNPKFSAKQIADLVLSLSEEPGDRELASFLGVLAENERLAVLPQIEELFAQLKSEDEQIKEAVVSTPYPLDEAQLKNLMTLLEPYFGSKLQPRVELDETLIGGVKITVGDQVLDASVRGKLEAMAVALKN